MVFKERLALLEDPDDEIVKQENLYYTPRRLAAKTIDTLEFDRDKEYYTILEPSAGRGSYIGAVKKRFKKPIIHGVEKYKDNAHFLKELELKRTQIFHTDFLTMQPAPVFDFVLGNPPYSFAQEFIEHSLLFLKDGGFLGFLLRLNFLGSQKRIPFWKVNPCYKISALSERPKFVGTGSDMTEYAFFQWKKGWTGQTTLEVIQWHPE